MFHVMKTIHTCMHLTARFVTGVALRHIQKRMAGKHKHSIPVIPQMHTRIAVVALEEIHTFTMAGVWQVVHITQELHEMAAQGGHDIGRVAASQATHHLYSQSPHNAGLIVQSHKQGPQAAGTPAWHIQQHASGVERTALRGKFPLHAYFCTEQSVVFMNNA